MGDGAAGRAGAGSAAAGGAVAAAVAAGSGTCAGPGMARGSFMTGGSRVTGGSVGAADSIIGGWIAEPIGGAGVAGRRGARAGATPLWGWRAEP